METGRLVVLLGSVLVRLRLYKAIRDVYFIQMFFR